VFVRSFADSDGDGIGDLKGLTKHLDHLNDGDPATTTDLGVGALWLMPTFSSPSYHGYDVTDYRSVNPDYGTLDDLRALVAEAHRRDIGVILDLPLNHTSDRHPWFVASAARKDGKTDWYVWSDKPEGNNWQEAPDGRSYYAAFGPDLPDLNLRNPAVTAEVTSDAAYWLDTVGVDGFRLDAAKYLIEDGQTTQNTPATHGWWKAFKAAVDVKTPGALLLGEVYDTPQNSSSYVPDDLDLTFDFGLASTEVTAAQSGDGNSVQRALTKITGLYPASSGFGAFLTNHDQDRIASQLKSDAGKLSVAADLLLTGPGVPFVYYGEEIGMTGSKPDERIRTPMRWDGTATAGFTTGTPWEALSADPPSVNVAAESQDDASLLSRYRTLIRLRAEHPALSTGTWLPVTSDQPNVVAALRVAPTETALVLTNVSAQPATPTLALPSGPLCGVPTVTSVLGAGNPTAPAVTAAGGFAGYRPVDHLDGQSTTVLVFGR
jgi:alpha-amylase